MIGQIWRLVIQNIGAKRANLTGIEGLDEGRLVDAKTAAQIDHNRLLLHLGEFLGVKVMVIRLVEVHVVDDDIGFGQNLIDFGALDTVLFKEVLIDKRIIGYNALDETLGFAGGALAYLAKAKDSECLVF